MLLTCGGLLTNQIYYPRTTGAEPFERAFRTQMNQIEQAVPFVALLWTCALFHDPDFAGVVGAVWVVCRICYSLLYRLRGSRGIALFTVPGAHGARAGNNT